MILILNRNDEKRPHTRQIKIAGRNHILPPLPVRNCMENLVIDNSQEGIKIECSIIYKKNVIKRGHGSINH